MPDEFAYASEEAKQAREAVNNATDHGQKALSEALGAAERTISAATHAAERLLKESLDALLVQTGAYTEEVRQHLEEGHHYVADHVKQRPLTYTLAGLGIGLLVGLVISSRPKKV